MKKDCPKVSIVVPCYNAEKYIRSLLDSIFNQTFKDYELICVNDGSTDSTLDILKDYQKKHSNMQVLTKKNEGGKNVTQMGLKIAKGQFICAVDNDDVLHKDYLKKLYNAITTTNSDISICGFQRVNYDTKKIISTEMCKKESCVDLINNYGALLEVNTSFWNKMYKRETIRNMLNFQLDSLGLGDMTIHAFLYSNVKKIAFVNDVLYYYQIRSNSNINVMKTEAVDSIYDNLKRIKEYYVKNNKEMCSFLDAYAFLHLGISLIYRLYRNSKKDFKINYKKNIVFLDEFFETWRYNEYYSFKYVLNNKGRNLKLWICKMLYKLHLFKAFIIVYDFLTSHFGFDIKW